MEFNVYNELNNSRARGSFSNPKITINPRYGYIVFSTSCACHGILSAGDKVEFLQSQDFPEDWYLRMNSETGFSVRKYKGGALIIQNSFLARKIVQSIGGDQIKTVRIPISGEIDQAAKAYALITAAATEKQHNEKR